MRQKSGYNGFYNAALTKNFFVSMDRTEATLNGVLDEAHKGTALDYTIENGTIVIHKREMAEDAKVRESRIVSGIIYDSEGYPLIGATIRVGASNRGTISNEDGLFKVTVPQDVHTLTVSYLGMKPQTIKIGAKNSISLYMKEDSRELDDVFVTGYQTISKERATGSYNIIKAEDIKQRNATNISSVLDGLVAGIQSADDDRGGRSFSIRGAGTMLGDNAPVIVVDGFPITDNSSSASRELNAFQKINPNDVESITVLKDSAAASIWGARSANGVIVITTKSGKNRDKLNVEVSTQMAVSNRYNINQVYNTARSADFIAYERMAFENGWTSGEFTGSFGELNYPVTQSQMLLYKGLRFGTMDSDEMERGLSALSQLDNREQIKKYLFEKPLLWQVNASISGGTEK